MSSTQQLLLTEGSGAIPNYIEDVFSTYLYTGNSGTQTITNNIDLSTKGGLVWIKNRTTGYSHVLTDTVRGANKQLETNNTNAQATETNRLTNFTTSGFTVSTSDYVNANTNAIASWTFRKQPKFFDVVTYTGAAGSAVQNIAHNLGSVPGCIIVKQTSGARNWGVYHRSLGNNQIIYLNLTDPSGGSSGTWDSTTPTSTHFTVGADSVSNASGQTYVAYLFAHNAGGFGLTGTDNVISCGSYTGTGSAVPVSLGYEPQWLLVKKADGYATDWVLLDTMRGMPTGGISAFLAPNLSNAENASVNTSLIDVSSTGFNVVGVNGRVNESGATYIYIAIRRGPMKVPTDATKVFVPTLYTGDGNATQTISSVTNVTDSNYHFVRNASGWASPSINDRLRGIAASLDTSNTGAETASSDYSVYPSSNTQTQLYAGTFANSPGKTWVNYSFSRAPSFFDVVCYKGGVSSTITHNLGAVPELMIVRSRSGNFWYVYNATIGASNWLILDQTNASGSSNAWNSTTPTSTVFTANTANDGVNYTGINYVAYLFATCAGVSKVGSYTGTGTLTTINCGFAGGARFVLIKRTDSTSNWFIWDTSRGMVSGTDPSLAANLTNAESNANSVYTITTGFQLLASPSADVNTSGGSYIYLAIA